MGFTKPCFIRKNNSELRKKLEELRYKLLNSGDTTLDAHNYDGKGSHIASSTYKGTNDGGEWDTYEEALEAAIQEALKLI